ncbi:cell wall-binding repeat-containing protein [Bacillus carboniphilus]|uniref:Cell wall-binding repeat-containing protein n=1 Tax=Bacillus carboniphilus TaxID=86663 RepID=A0ABY9JQC7_9BACI|nr:cell wall-binding repeat-containing protein [Bacillus carboniphilus]WLR41602.1 cell wall-binding repeat-containing protein [Bacillus carboniphilus]
MKKNTLFFKLVLVFSLVMMTAVPFAHAGELNIPDQNLREALMDNLPEGEALTAENLAQLEEIYLFDYEISNLEGIQYAKNVKHIELGMNKLSSIDQLKHLEMVQYIGLRSNKITDIAPLKELSTLSGLDLSDNPLDLSSLNGLNLNKEEGWNYLGLNNLNLTDLSVLKSMNIDTEIESFHLEVSDNQLTNFSGLENFSQLTILVAMNNNISDLSHIKSLENLNVLDLDNNNVDSQQLKNIPSSVSDLWMTANKLTSLEGLTFVDGGSYGFMENDINTISALQGVKSGMFYLSNNQISDLSPLKSLQSGEVVLFENPLNSDAKGIMYELSDRGVAVYADEFIHLKERLAGDNRFETAVDISMQGWPYGADTVVLAKNSDFPDALAGTPLAYNEDAPILLTEADHLPFATEKEIDRLGAYRVIILGGEKAISKSVQQKLEDKGLEVERIGGNDRYHTAQLIAENLGGSPDTAVVAYGKKFPDALSIASFAAQNGLPILLADKEQLPSATKTALKGIDQTIVVGGKAVISEDVKNMLPKATRIGGENRFDTAAKIVSELNLDTSTAFYANGNKFPDALVGSVLAAKNSAPLLLVESDHIPKETLNVVKDYTIDRHVFLGGHKVISEKVISDIKAIQ